MKLLSFLISLIFVCMLMLTSCASNPAVDTTIRAAHAIDARSLKFEQALADYIAGKDARIGVAIIFDDKDTVEVNGNIGFPMMSVVKFPQALALAGWLDARGMSLGDTVLISPEDLMEETYSPMLKMYGKRDMSMTYRELLVWSLIESDNNACDIIFKHLGGVDGATAMLQRLGVAGGISVVATEADMYRDKDLCALNSSTPLAMAALFNCYDTGMRHKSYNFMEIAGMLEQCRTGSDRLAAPLMMTNAVIGHKTGTGFTSPQGRIMALNDCGYVRLPGGRHYSIAVFIADSGYDAGETAKMIADISEMAYAQAVTACPVN